MSGNYGAIKNGFAKEIAAYIEANIKTVLIVLLIVAAVTILLGVICIIANWRIYEKAGESGWWSLIPILNGHVAYKIAWHPFFYWITFACLFGVEFLSTMQFKSGVSMPLAAMALSLASAIISIVYNVKLSKAFGHGIGFAVGLIFLPVIFIPILGFGDSIYYGKVR